MGVELGLLHWGKTIVSICVRENCAKKMLGSKYDEDRENYIMTPFETSLHIIFEWSNQKRLDGYDMLHFSFD